MKEFGPVTLPQHLEDLYSEHGSLIRYLDVEKAIQAPLNESLTKIRSRIEDTEVVMAGLERKLKWRYVGGVLPGSGRIRSKIRRVDLTQRLNYSEESYVQLDLAHVHANKAHINAKLDRNNDAARHLVVNHPEIQDIAVEEASKAGVI